MWSAESVHFAVNVIVGKADGTEINAAQWQLVLVAFVYTVARRNIQESKTTFKVVPLLWC